MPVHMTPQGTVTYRDLNKNGRIDPYEDPRLPVDVRVADLLAQMTLEDKAGLMFHTMLGANPGRDTGRGARPHGAPGHPRDGRSDASMSHFNLHALPTPRIAAEWQNRLQKLAEGTRLGIPVTLSSDPRHAFSNDVLTAARASGNSQWPEPIGLAAIGDPTWCSALPTSPVRSTSPWAFAWRCTPWPIWPPSPAGGASAAPLARTPIVAAKTRRRLHPRLPGRDARTHQRGLHDQALSRGRAADGRPGRALSRGARSRSIPAARLTII